MFKIQYCLYLKHLALGKVILMFSEKCIHHRGCTEHHNRVLLKLLVGVTVLHYT